MDYFFNMEPLSWIGLGSAALSGAIIGFERQLLGKPVGVRTSILICIGTYIFVTVANSINHDITDPSRIIGQVVTGIGFLGAGVMLTRDGMVIGVTSASAIWILAAVGVMIGTGYNASGIKVATLAVIVLVGVDTIEHLFGFMQTGVHKIAKRKKKQSE